MAQPHDAKRFRQLQARGADGRGYVLSYRPKVRVRGWPTPAARPYVLHNEGDDYLGSFANLDSVERRLERY